MLGHIEVQHLATIVFQDDKHEQDLDRDGRHGKEIGGYHLAYMVVQDGPPGLVGGRRSVRRRRETVRSERAIPSILSSPSTLGARHSGLAANGKG
jgi:hypothetical protein